MSERIDAVLTVGANLEWENAMNQIKMFKKEVEGEYLNYIYKLELPVDNKLLLLDYKFCK